MQNKTKETEETTKEIITERPLDEMFTGRVGGTKEEPVNEGIGLQSSGCPYLIWMEANGEEDSPEPSCVDITWNLSEMQKNIDGRRNYLPLNGDGLCSKFRGMKKNPEKGEPPLLVLCAVEDDIVDM